jgi:two-component system, sporulation sensor kinase D
LANFSGIDFYSKKNTWKVFLLIIALLIGLATVWYTETFLTELRTDQRRQIEVWAEAIKSTFTAPDDAELNFEYTILASNVTIPVILTDDDGNIITYNNLDPKKIDKPEYLTQQLEAMKGQHEPLTYTFGEGQRHYIYYKDSTLLTQLRIYPRVLLAVIAIFMLISYFAFSSARKSEQNRVWTGMAKETAHQIGTPLSSLMGWIEILREQRADPQAIAEMEKDIQRLITITDRFSKIGSVPVIKPEPIYTITKEVVDYLRLRASSKITFEFDPGPIPENFNVALNKQLYGWVVENLLRNAVDATEGKGRISVRFELGQKHLRIDVEDTGKGMNKRQARAIFRPGYTTKTRGWGLGLSLARRIVENYHKGKIFVLRSEPGQGSTIRILLPKIPVI